LTAQQVSITRHEAEVLSAVKTIESGEYRELRLHPDRMPSLSPDI
jgi:hypothetical protein